MQSARAVALEALSQGGDTAEHLDAALRKNGLQPADRAFATELAYGTLKMRRSLVWSLSRCLNRPFEELEPRVRWVLLLGAYQILFLDRVPVHSAVDESVRLARAHGGHKGIAGLTNAVLRKLATTRPRPPVPSPEAGSESLGLHASLPDWIAAHLIKRFGFDDAVRAAEGMNAAPRRALRAVDAASAVALTDELNASGAQARTGRYGIPEAVIVDRLGDGAAVRAAIAAGRAVWQSEESQLAVHLLAPQPGEVILDVCCGRGVKTMMIGGRLRGSGTVWSIDDDEQKLAALEKSKWSGRPLWSTAAVVHVIRADARGAYPDMLPRAVDAAIVDAPCSGIGIIGRRPDARWRKREADPARFASVQKAVLHAAAQRVRAGGRLLYVTCSTHPLEDEAIIGGFLDANQAWTAAQVTLPTAAARSIGRYALTVPGIDGADGFFYALLTRQG